MQSFKLIGGDIQFDSRGELIMIDGEEELGQCCEIAIGTNNGEWFLNPELGIKFSAFLGKNLSEEEMRDELRAGLLQEDRIQSVGDITFEADNTARTMIVSFTATSKNGDVIRKEEVTIGAG